MVMRTGFDFSIIVRPKELAAGAAITVRGVFFSDQDVLRPPRITQVLFGDCDSRHTLTITVNAGTVNMSKKGLA